MARLFPLSGWQPCRARALSHTPGPGGQLHKQTDLASLFSVSLGEGREGRGYSSQYPLGSLLVLRGRVMHEVHERVAGCYREQKRFQGHFPMSK